MSGQLTTLNNAIMSVQPTFVDVQADKSISFSREAEFALQSLTANTYLAGVAMKNQQSLIDAVTNVAALGVSLNPAEKQAYLVPRGGRVCLDISYMGLMDLATSSGSIEWAKADLVYESDEFQLNDIDKKPTHRRQPFAKDRGQVVGAYVVVKLPTGDYLTETMSRNDLDDIKNRSESGKKGTGPWATDEGEMQKKTVVKRASKYWPKNPRLAKAIDLLNTDGGEGLQDIPQVKQLTQDRMDSFISEVAQAETTDQLASVWHKGVKEIQANGNRYQYETFKAAVNDKKAFIEGNTVDAEAVGQPHEADSDG